MLWASNNSLKPLPSFEASETKRTWRLLSVVCVTVGGVIPHKRPPRDGALPSGPFLN